MMNRNRRKTAYFSRVRDLPALKVHHRSSVVQKKALLTVIQALIMMNDCLPIVHHQMTTSRSRSAIPSMPRRRHNPVLYVASRTVRARMHVARGDREMKK